MGCCEAKVRHKKDNFTDLERSFGLFDIHITDFHAKLHLKAGDRTITIAELGEAFGDDTFGKKIKSAGENDLKRLLSHELF